MSWYYSYWIGTKDQNGMFYPLGPFNNKGERCYVIDRSRSFASDLHEDFSQIPYNKLSKELRDLIYKNYDLDEEEIAKAEEENKYPCGMHPYCYLPLENLTSDSFIKSGFFLNEDIVSYEKDHDSENIFYDSLTPTEYALRLANETKLGLLGKPQKRTDDFGEEYEVPSVSEYSYYAYPDYLSKEYESFLLREAVDILTEYHQIPEGNKIVVLLAQG